MASPAATNRPENAGTPQTGAIPRSDGETPLPGHPAAPGTGETTVFARAGHDATPPPAETAQEARPAPDRPDAQAGTGEPQIGDPATPQVAFQTPLAPPETNQARAIYAALGIQKTAIDQGQPWQNYIETHFNVMRRMADHDYAKATTWSELQVTHERFFRNYNHQAHFAHRDRTDDRRSPATVLGWVQGAPSPRAAPSASGTGASTRNGDWLAHGRPCGSPAKP